MRSYKGRFAPSPTGPLHFGSLVAAVGGYLEARCNKGEWLLRIEDLDTPRTVAGAADSILRTLEACGMQWDGPVPYQSTRNAAYQAALDQLSKAGAVYGCACTRREIADSGIHGIDGPVYPGTCRNGISSNRVPRATRVRTQGVRISFADAVQGEITQDVENEIGDFVLARADGFFAYQLAVVIDDHAQGITHIVRGADLLDSTPRQLWLQQCMGLPTPAYAHLPVAVNARGEKLSKQTHATAVDAGKPAPLLVAALRFLGQRAPAELAAASVATIWQWALAHWRRDNVPRQRVASVDVQVFSRFSIKGA